MKCIKHNKVKLFSFTIALLGLNVSAQIYAENCQLFKDEYRNGVEIHGIGYAACTQLSNNPYSRPELSTLIGKNLNYCFNDEAITNGLSTCYIYDLEREDRAGAPGITPDIEQQLEECQLCNSEYSKHNFLTLSCHHTHTFCLECLRGIVKKNPLCPFDRSNISRHDIQRIQEHVAK